MKRKTERERNVMEEAGEANGFLVEHGNVKGDETNIAILLFLYLLQGIPLGLCSSIPMILQNHGVSYKQQVGTYLSRTFQDINDVTHLNYFILFLQAEFSFVIWPFSLKLLWAPIVDSVFISKFGRRKTWLLPVQYLMGIFMLFLSGNVDRWLGNEEGSYLNIGLLTVLFFILNVLAATQDIVVDGWALTMLKRYVLTG